MTLAQLEALEERRTIELRHARFNAALVASTLYNINRPKDVDPLSAFDFLPGFDKDPAEIEQTKQRRAMVHNIRATFAMLPPGANAVGLRVTMIDRLRANGHEDAEEMFTEAYPTWQT